MRLHQVVHGQEHLDRPDVARDGEGAQRLSKCRLAAGQSDRDLHQGNDADERAPAVPARTKPSRRWRKATTRTPRWHAVHSMRSECVSDVPRGTPYHQLCKYSSSGMMTLPVMKLSRMPVHIKSRPISTNRDCCAAGYRLERRIALVPRRSHRR